MRVCHLQLQHTWYVWYVLNLIRWWRRPHVRRPRHPRSGGPVFAVARGRRRSHGSARTLPALHRGHSIKVVSCLPTSRATQKCTEIMKHNFGYGIITHFPKECLPCVYDVYDSSRDRMGLGWDRMASFKSAKGAPLKVPQRYCRLPFETITWTNRDQPGPTRHYMSTRAVAITDSYRLSMPVKNKIPCPFSASSPHV